MAGGLPKLLDKAFAIGFLAPALLAVLAVAWIFPGLTVLDPVRNLSASEKSLTDLTYEYFPEAQAIDLEDFWPPDRILSTMQAIGFVAISVSPEHRRFEQDLRAWLDMVRRRDLNSQLMAISDRAYKHGIARLEDELADGGSAHVRTDHLCLLTIQGDKSVTFSR